MTDGGKITSDGNIRSDIVIPGSTLPGSNFIVEPFRWDQRVFSLTMKFSAGDDVENTKLANQPNYLAPLCDVTGGRSHIVTSPKNILDTLHSIGTKIQTGTGVMINFEKMSDKAANGRPELGNGLVEQKWHKTNCMVYVKHNYKTGNFQGFWPIPESFWIDPNEAQLPKRNAQPTLKFSCRDSKPLCLSSFAFDKLELESSPLTSAMIDRKRPDVCWQVFVENSGKFGGPGKPIGYLKPNSQNTIVNLFIHPYDYEKALDLVNELFENSMKPSPKWRKEWDEYLAGVPNYYISHFKKALIQARAPPDVIQDAFDVKLNGSIQTQLKKIKNQLRTEAERHIEIMKKNRLEISMEKSLPVIHPKTPSQSLDTNSEFKNFDLFNRQRNIRKRPYLEAFDVSRNTILSDLNRMRVSFKQSLRCGIPIHKEHLLHEQSISQMGLYQQYIKNNIQPLRDPDPEARPSAKPTFGNPWKKGGRGDNLDVDGIDGIDSINDRLHDTRNKRRERSSDIKPKKRTRKISLLSLRNRNSDMSDNGSVCSSDITDDDEVFISDSVFDHSKHNGFSHNMENGIRENGHTPKKSLSPQNQAIFNQLSKYIKSSGIQHSKFCDKLTEIDMTEVEDVRAELVQLELKAIRYSRWALLDLLEDFNRSDQVHSD